MFFFMYVSTVCVNVCVCGVCTHMCIHLCHVLMSKDIGHCALSISALFFEIRSLTELRATLQKTP